MKKTLAILSLITLSLVCVACGKDNDKKKTENTTVAEKETSTNEATTEEKQKSQVVYATSTDVDYSKQEDIKIGRATVSDAMLENKSIGIAFPVTKDMQVLSDSEIAAKLAIGQNMFGDDERYTIEDFEDAMNGISYDSLILLDEGNTLISISFNNTKKSGIYDDSLADFVNKTAEALVNNQSVNYTIKSIEDVKLGGKSYVRTLVGTDVGKSQMIYVRREANYIIQVSITYPDEKESWAKEFIDSFVEVK